MSRKVKIGVFAAGVAAALVSVSAMGDFRDGGRHGGHGGSGGHGGPMGPGGHGGPMGPGGHGGPMGPGGHGGSIEPIGPVGPIGPGGVDDGSIQPYPPVRPGPDGQGRFGRVFCESRRMGEMVLRFGGERVYAMNGGERLPLKRILADSCGVPREELDSVFRVAVKGRTFTEYSAVWIESDSASSHYQYLTHPRSRWGFNDRVVFSLNGPTRGRLQVVFSGDLLLDDVRVEFSRGMQPPYPGPGPMPF